MNSIALQLGHLIAAERMFAESVSPGISPELPAGFKESHDLKNPARDEKSRPPSRRVCEALGCPAHRPTKKASLQASAMLKLEDTRGGKLSLNCLCRPLAKSRIWPRFARSQPFGTSSWPCDRCSRSRSRFERRWVAEHLSSATHDELSRTAFETLSANARSSRSRGLRYSETECHSCARRAHGPVTRDSHGHGCSQEPPPSGLVLDRPDYCSPRQNLIVQASRKAGVTGELDQRGSRRVSKLPHARNEARNLTLGLIPRKLSRRPCARRSSARCDIAGREIQTKQNRRPLDRATLEPGWDVIQREVRQFCRQSPSNSSSMGKSQPGTGLYRQAFAEFREIGVREYWIIDRFRRENPDGISLHRVRRTRSSAFPEDQSYETPLLPGFVLPLKPITRPWPTRWARKRRK